MPGVKAELIEGVVYMASPVRCDFHGEPSRSVSGWLWTYQGKTPGVRGSDNTTVWLDADNEPQPDHMLYLPKPLGGQSDLNAQGYRVGAPELIVEVAASSASYDLHDKLKIYRRSGVREYVVWRTLDKAVDWFVAREGEFRPLAPDSKGWFQSEVFPGLWLDPAALIGDDIDGILSALHCGLATPEHAAFAARLRELAATQAK